jgi:hypothetical protein
MKGLVNARRGSRSSRAALNVACAAALGLATSASAVTTPVTFAQFSQTTNSLNANQFEYLDNGPSADSQFVSTNGTTSAIPVVFDYLTITNSLPADLQGPQNATLTLQASSTSPVQSVAFLGQTLVAQPINNSGSLTDILTITRDTPAAEGNGTKTVLLQVDFTGILGGSLGTRTPELQGTSNNGDVIVYSSDFLNFSGTAANDYNIAFTSWISGDGGGLEQSGSDSYYASGTAAGAGSFDTTFTPSIGFPEPGSLSLLGVGAGALLSRRRRKA